MAAGASAAGARQAGFRQVNLVSDIPGVAPLTDPDLLNAWGLAATPGTDQAPGSPLWVSDNGSDKTTLFAGAAPGPVAQVLVVNITSGAPTGQVFNPDRTGFFVHDAAGNSGSALFLFASENGAIDAWNPGVGATGTGPSTVTETPIDNGANAVYKGLALAPAGFGGFGGALLVGNFGDGHINAYNPGTGTHLGQLRGPGGHPVVIDGLWALRFGNGNAAKTSELVFSAGPNGEADGLLGKIIAAG